MQLTNDKMKIQSPQNPAVERNSPKIKKNKPKKFPFRLNFELSKQDSLLTTVDVNSVKKSEQSKTDSFFPLFEESNILFLQKQIKIKDDQNKKPLISVDIAKERIEKLNKTKTLNQRKKMFRKRPKKLLKLNIKKTLNSEPSIPTVDQQVKEIYQEAER